MADPYQFNLSVPPDLSAEQIKYIQHLYDLSIPCLSDRFPDDHCRVWTRSKKKDGYAAHRVPKHLQSYSKSTLVHKFLYEMFDGKIGESSKDEELTIEHRCGRTSCINLRHLELLPRELNKDLGDPRKL